MAGMKIESVIAAGFLNGFVSTLAKRRVIAIDPYSFDSELTCPIFDQSFRSTFERLQTRPLLEKTPI